MIDAEQNDHVFQMCVSKAKDWEKKLENLSRLWRVLNQKQNVLESWLEQAQAVLEDTEDDYESIIRKHKGFFVRVDERMLKDYLRAGQDILCVLEEEDRPALTESMENLQQRWEVSPLGVCVHLTWRASDLLDARSNHLPCPGVIWYFLCIFARAFPFGTKPPLHSGVYGFALCIFMIFVRGFLYHIISPMLLV